MEAPQNIHAEYTVQSLLSQTLLTYPAPQLKSTFLNPAQYHQIPNGQGNIDHGDIYNKKRFKDIK